jgi:hypothetical protein
MSLNHTGKAYQQKALVFEQEKCASRNKLRKKHLMVMCCGNAFKITILNL